MASMVWPPPSHGPVHFEDHVETWVSVCLTIFRVFGKPTFVCYHFMCDSPHSGTSKHMRHTSIVPLCQPRCMGPWVWTTMPIQMGAKIHRSLRKNFAIALHVFHGNQGRGSLCGLLRAKKEET